MNDDPATIVRKFKRAVTDSDNRIVCAEDKKGITNLLTIYSAFTDKTIEEAEKEFEGKGYGEFKVRVGEAVADTIEPIRQEKNKLLQNKDYLDQVLKSGAERASYVAYKTLNKVYKKVGLVPRIRG
jgi:tryptophanyl-tRNA synthetase